MNPRLNISSNPHARTGHDTFHEMYNVILALIPAAVFGIAHFGIHSLFIICAGILGAMSAEYVFDMIAGRLELFPLLMLFHPTIWKEAASSSRLGRRLKKKNLQ